MDDKVIRTLGYTELWERARRVLAVEGDQAENPWHKSDPLPTHFNWDGEPGFLFAHVLAGLGVSREQVLANLLPYNDSAPSALFAAAGYILTDVASEFADRQSDREILGVYWSEGIGERTAYGPHHPRWTLQDEVSLAEVEGTSGTWQPTPETITAITAPFPVTPPSGMADAPDFQVGYEVWMRAAEQAGEGTTWTTERSTFEVDSAPVDASTDDDNVCAAILVNYRWYVIERDGDTVRARLVPID